MRLKKSMILKYSFFRKLSGKLLNSRKVGQSKKFNSDKSLYYQNSEFLKQYTKKEIFEINEIISADLFEFLGYKKH